MAKKTLIKNAKIVNEGRTFVSDILIKGALIERIDNNISDFSATIFDIEEQLLFPGVIDDQVHFRDPPGTGKGDFETESKAALSGGITSFIDQPNTSPQTTTTTALKKKFQVAKNKSYANYSFLFGATNDNLEIIKTLNPHDCAGLKIFMGSSTGDMLVDNESTLEQIFLHSPFIKVVHSEDEAIIQKNLAIYKKEYGDDIPIKFHPEIRSREACLKSSTKAIKLARKTDSRLHVFHVSTADEIPLFEDDVPLKNKKITAEACVHHLWFSDNDYEKLGTKIKWNPAVKTANDRNELRKAINKNAIDVIASDHAPHEWDEKQNPYTSCPSGGPLVQHSLLAVLELVYKGVFTLETLVEKMCHNPAIIFRIKQRGFIREGYYADLAVIDPKKKTVVNKENILYKCKWSPFMGTTFNSQVTKTFLNGHLVYDNGLITPSSYAKPLAFYTP